MQPEEYLNNDLKGNVHAAGLPNNQQELRSGMQTFLHRLAHLPERIMSDFKAYASRYLNRMSLDEPIRKRWASAPRASIVPTI